MVKILFYVRAKIIALDEIKALEQKYQILTQDLKFSKCFETGKRDTMKNIVQKMNMKNGGSNHHVIDVSRQLDQRVLVLGIEVKWPNYALFNYWFEWFTVSFRVRTTSLFQFTHPPPCLPGKEPASPSVLGFASNCTAQSQYFVGDYKFIPARSSDDHSEISIHLKNVYEETIQRFKASRGAVPGLVIIYRNGASEGQYPIVSCYLMYQSDVCLYVVDWWRNPTLLRDLQQDEWWKIQTRTGDDCRQQRSCAPSVQASNWRWKTGRTEYHARDSGR